MPNLESPPTVVRDVSDSHWKKWFSALYNCVIQNSNNIDTLLAGSGGDSLPSGGTEGQILYRTSSGYMWDDPPVGIPAGGTTSEVLTKLSNADYDADWVGLQLSHEITGTVVALTITTYPGTIDFGQIESSTASLTITPNAGTLDFGLVLFHNDPDILAIYYGDSISGTTVTDLSIAGNDATNVNSMTTGTGVDGTGTALGYSFNRTETPVDINFNTGNYKSISFWVYPDSSVSTSDVVLYYAAGAYSYQFFSGSYLASSGLNLGNDESTQYSKNCWFHVVIQRRFDTGTTDVMEHWFNGRLVDSDIVSTSFDFGDGPGTLTIGSTTSGSATFSGKVQAVRLFDRELSTSEIQQLYEEFDVSFEGFGVYDTSAQLQDWIEMYDTGGSEITKSIVTNTGIDNKQLQAVLAIDRHTRIERQLLPMGSTLEVLAKIQTTGSLSSGDRFNMVSLKTSNSVTLDGYVAGQVYGTDLFQIGKYDGGVFTSLDSTSFTASTSTYYWIRFNFNSGAMNASIWLDGDPEPGSWMVSDTNTDLVTGLIGFDMDVASTLLIDWFDYNRDGSTITQPT